MNIHGHLQKTSSVMSAHVVLLPSQLYSGSVQMPLMKCQGCATQRKKTLTLPPATLLQLVLTVALQSRRSRNLHRTTLQGGLSRVYNIELILKRAGLFFYVTVFIFTFITILYKISENPAQRTSETLSMVLNSVSLSEYCTAEPTLREPEGLNCFSSCDHL